MQTDDPYGIICVSKTASIDEIKKAYRKMSLRHHPDRNNNSDESNRMFQLISKSYEKLISNCEHSSYVNPSNDRTHTFNAMANTEIQVSSTAKPNPLIVHLDITLEQSYTGCMIPLELERWIIDGNTKRTETEKIYIHVPKGIDNNEILMYHNKGNICANGNTGDIKIFINIIKHDMFERIGLDIIFTKVITLKEALCGVVFHILHISGRKYRVSNIDEFTVISPSFKRVIQGLGIERDTHTGNLIIHFNIEFPESLTKEQCAQISCIL
jgi:DnaJ-class molecular chaperone